MKITIEVIPHLKQRYNTCGDWQFDKNGNLTIRVSEMPITGYKGSMLIAVHELVEALLCQDRGITTEMVDEFDLKFDPTADWEPGDDPTCPCYKEHCLATGVERILASELDVPWLRYDSEIISMTDEYEDFKASTKENEDE